MPSPQANLFRSLSEGYGVLQVLRQAVFPMARVVTDLAEPLPAPEYQFVAVYAICEGNQFLPVLGGLADVFRCFGQTSHFVGYVEELQVSRRHGLLGEPIARPVRGRKTE